MEIIAINELNPQLEHDLLTIWTSAVKATHLFLSENEIKNIKNYVPEALKSVQHLIVIQDELGHPAGFMGINNKTLEMLFVANASRGQGLGKRLLTFGIENYGVNRLGVNEQNPLAKGFYEHMGFKVYKRTEQDEQGNDYPILYMKK